MYKLKLSILLNLMFVSTFAVSEQGCNGKCEGNELKYENDNISSKKVDTIGTEHASPGNPENENLQTQINKKDLDNKHAFKGVKFMKHKNLLHKTPFNSPKRAKNHIQNVEKELLMATEKLKALFKPIKFPTKKPIRNYIKLQRKKRSLNPNERIMDLSDNLRYGSAFNTKFDNKFGHKFDLSPTGRLITQGFVNKSRSGNDKDYLTHQGHKLSSSPEEPSKQEEWNVRKGRGSGYDTNGSQGYANQYLLNPAAAQLPVNNFPPLLQSYFLPYKTLNEVGNNPLTNQPNNLAQPYDRTVPVSDPRLISLYGQGNVPQFGYNALPNNVPVNLPLQSPLAPLNYYPLIPNIF